MSSKKVCTEIDALEKVYECGSYVVFVVDNGYILYNTEKEFISGHTHLKSLKKAKAIINNCMFKKKPKDSNMYILSSHIRVSNDKAYIEYIESLMAVKKSKCNGNYCNSKNRRLK